MEAKRFFFQFNTEITHLKSEENIIADALSRVNVIQMPTILDPETIEKEQNKEEELKDVLNKSIKLQRLKMDPHWQTAIYCDTSTGSIRPYIPFDNVHGWSYRRGRTTTRLIKVFLYC